jgi:2-methylisocitrate lyase-like PEP mutase family enzyme
MTLKIEAPHKAKQDSYFILNACTDAIAVEGVEGEARQGICRTGCCHDVP